MSLQRLASETAVYGLSSILGRLLNFVVIVPFVTRPEVFTEEQFGVVGDLFFFVAFFIALLVFRMDTVVFRYASRAEYDATAVCRRAQRFVWVSVAIWTLGGLLLAGQIADWMQYPDRVLYIQLFVLIVSFDVLAAVPLARLRLEARPWTFAGVNLVNILVNIVLIYGLLWFVPRLVDAGRSLDWYDPLYKIAYYFIAILVASIVRYLLLLLDRSLREKKHFDWRSSKPLNGPPNETNSAPSLNTMLRYATPLVLVAVCGVVNSLAGPSFLKMYDGGTVTQNLFWSGQYNAAMKMAVFLNLFTAAYNFAAEPFFFRKRGRNPTDRDLSLYADATRAFAWVCSLAIGGILLMLPLLQYYLGEDLREGLVVLPILLGANFLLALYYNFALAYKLTDRTYLGGWIALGGSTIVVVGNVLFIPAYGMYAAAWSSLLCFAFMTVAAYFVSRRYFPVPYPLGRIGLYLLLTAGVVALGWHLDSLLLRSGLLLVLTMILVGLEYRWLRALR